MAFVYDHSGNFPHDFYKCGVCGDKGVYICSGVLNDTVRIACKYCKTTKILERGIVLPLEVEARLLAYK